jgi:hypothetical protein
METLAGEILRAIVVEQHSFSWSQVNLRAPPTTLPHESTKRAAQTCRGISEIGAKSPVKTVCRCCTGGIQGFVHVKAPPHREVALMR